MRHLILLLLVLLYTSVIVKAQGKEEKLRQAFAMLEKDKDLKHAIIGLKIIDSKNGSAVFEKNAEAGLAPASCLKLITAATSFEILGKDFFYKTTLGYDGKISDGKLNGNLVLSGSGDPTLGSWRYESTKETNVIKRLKDAAEKAGIREINGEVIISGKSFRGETIPDGWIWQDIGNYYGAGAQSVNWRENQFDLLLSSGSHIGDTVVISGTRPQQITGLHLRSEATAAKTGSGDNAYIYFPLNDATGHLRGTIPINKKDFEISGAMPSPSGQFRNTLLHAFDLPNSSETNNSSEAVPAASTVIYTHNSPTLDSIIYWFLKKSINLYGEALIKTLGEHEISYGSTDSGVTVVRNYWKTRGIDPYALNMIDGSGLSPGNRITADALVTVLSYAREKVWYPEFFKALPVINGIHMKSGSIGGVLSYAGYITSSGNENYTFAFIINNYNGSSSAMRNKMWRFLDLLK